LVIEKKFLDIFSKNTQMLYFMKIRPVGAELFHADRQTDITKLIGFTQFFEVLTGYTTSSSLSL